jgi:hypothetical protein
MNTGMFQPLVGFLANAPMNTPVFWRPSAWRSSSDFCDANARYSATASAGERSTPNEPRHSNGESWGHWSGTITSTSGCSGASTM